MDDQNANRSDKQRSLERAMHGALHPHDAARVVDIAEASGSLDAFRRTLASRLPKLIHVADQLGEHLYPGAAFGDLASKARIIEKAKAIAKEDATAEELEAIAEHEVDDA